MLSDSIVPFPTSSQSLPRVPTLFHFLPRVKQNNGALPFFLSGLIYCKIRIYLLREGCLRKYFLNYRFPTSNPPEFLRRKKVRRRALFLLVVHDSCFIIFYYTRMIDNKGGTDMRAKTYLFVFICFTLVFLVQPACDTEESTGVGGGGNAPDDGILRIRL